MQTFEEGDGIKVHFHLFLQAETNMWAASAANFLFRGTEPHRSHKIAIVGVRSNSSNAGTYYLCCPRVGLVRCCSPQKAHSHYGVSPE